MTNRRGASHRPVVLMSFNAPPGGGNPYTAYLADSVGDARLTYFSWRTALVGRWDILHLHWPEVLVRGRSRVRVALRYALTLALVLRILLRRAPVVWTVHNATPHESLSPLAAAAMKTLMRTVSVRIYLNDSEENDTEVGVVILHGDYVQLASQHKDPAWVTRMRDVKQILFFGLIRPYKGIESLLAAFTDVAEDDDILLIRGAVRDEGTAARISLAVDRDPRVTFIPGFVDDDALLEDLSLTRLVVLPYIAMYNSGALIMALSFGCPVLAPRSDANEALQREVGDQALVLYEGELNGTKLRDALDAAARERTATSLLVSEGRDWSVGGRKHAALYLALISSSAVRDPATNVRAVREAWSQDL